jgi:hypothetical protein
MLRADIAALNTNSDLGHPTAIGIYPVFGNDAEAASKN